MLHDSAFDLWNFVFRYSCFLFGLTGVAHVSEDIYPVFGFSKSRQLTGFVSDRQLLNCSFTFYRILYDCG